MKPAMWTQFLKGLPLSEIIAVFAGRGWTAAELSSEHGFELLERGDPETVGRAFRELIDDHGVSIPQGHLWLSCDIAGSDQDAVVAKLKRWLDLYLAMGIRAGVVHPGGRELAQKGASPMQVLDAQVRGLRALAEYIKGTDLVICLENIGHFAEDLVAIIDAAGCDNLGICLDTGHLNIIPIRANLNTHVFESGRLDEPGDQADFIRTAAGLLKATHIADNNSSGDQHLMPFGVGTVDWAKVVSALRQIGYDGLFNFEVPGDSQCPIPVRLAKLDYLKTILPILLDE